MNSFLNKMAAGLLLAVSMCSALTPSASANGPMHPPTIPAHGTHHHHTRQYYVYYRVDPSSPWVSYGYTPSHSDAAWYANWIRSTYGYDAYGR